ncbi:NUDIX hydrolase [Pseudochelatococcus sp. B33]
MRIVPVWRVDATLEAGPWPWAERNRARIAANWDRRRMLKPALFNGVVLVCTRRALDGEVLDVRFRAADYASFLAMMDFGFPEPDVGNCFGAAVLRAADGTIVLGEMAAHTANGGRAYFPGGSLDLEDVRADGSVDVGASIRRELLEETGLGPADVSFAPGFTAVIDGPRTALLKEARSPLPAPVLRQRIEAFIAGEAEPELAGVRLVRSPADVDPDIMPAYVAGFVRAAFPP